jgi:hypothetical protein
MRVRQTARPLKRCAVHLKFRLLCLFVSSGIRADLIGQSQRVSMMEDLPPCPSRPSRLLSCARRPAIEARNLVVDSGCLYFVGPQIFFYNHFRCLAASCSLLHGRLDRRPVYRNVKFGGGQEVCAYPDVPRILPQYAVLEWRLRGPRIGCGGFMRFDRSAGGHNFDFDTDVCTQCGIVRRQYRDGGNPQCTAREVMPLVAPMDVPSTRLVAPVAST